MSLRIYNTLTRQKEPFVPVESGKVKMYTCGPTVYKPAHIGHMVGPVIFDTVRRYLEYLGYEVIWVLNITDVDDKLIARAREENTTVRELAERHTLDYLECLRALQVQGIRFMPRATEHIPDMIRIIEGLIARGHAYVADGDVYFDVTSDPDYGKLCHRDPEQMAAGARIEVSEKKRHPGDFALWKSAKPGEPSWESPWGLGRPGWHIECSAMSMRYLGETLDIHGGGLDLQFPHHENELAQSECFTGKPFVRYWMHNGLLKFGQTKMAGSLGNVVNVHDLLQRYPGETLRFFLLSTHYRSPIEFSEERLEALHKSLGAFYRFFERYQRITGKSFYDVSAPTRYQELALVNGSFAKEIQQLRQRFLQEMDDDFNTQGAIGVLFGLLTALNRFADEHHLEDAAHREAAPLARFEQAVVVLRELTQILGLFLSPLAVSVSARDRLVSDLVQILLDVRNECRKQKQFALADMIRSRLTELGIVVEDRPGGTTWRWQQ
ncbi:MAG: cysteine--tRNA ligase [Gemmatales bacterium]|nr:cysteine--tRNA ligase [Gemmatales bacterium]MDW7993782.1 cysteine--tRNA ligase [Gemmatales bacterium]